VGLGSVRNRSQMSTPLVTYTYRNGIHVNTTMPTDWKNCAVPTLRAVLAEAVTAEIAEAMSVEGSTRWFGGQNAAFDVSSVEERFNPDSSPDAETFIQHDVRRDAKSIRLETNTDGDWAVLARSNAQQYDPAKVDVITLVHMGETETGFTIDLNAGIASGAATAQILDAWEVPVERMNELLADIDENRGDRTIRNCLLDLDDIEEFRAFGRIRAYYPAWLEEARAELANCEDVYAGCLEDIAAIENPGTPVSEASRIYEALESSAKHLIAALLAVHVGRRVEGFTISFDGAASLSVVYDGSSVNGVSYPLADLVEKGVVSGELSRRLNDLLGSFGIDPDMPSGWRSNVGLHQYDPGTIVLWPEAPQLEPSSGAES